MRALRQPEAVILNSCGWRGYKRPAGSKTTASYQKEPRGTRESRGESHEEGNTYKPIDGKRC
jgi:hypothetical protein